MDILSHGLWGGVGFARKTKKSFWLAFGFGVAPDLFSFGIFTIMNIFGIVSGPDWSNGPPSNESIPAYVHSLYNLTHSLVIFSIIFLVVWAVRKKPLYEMLAWPLHILLDIPTHSIRFFATPFLWPLASYKIDGVPWSNPWIFFSNWILLFGVYGYLWHQKKKRMHSKKEKTS